MWQPTFGDVQAREDFQARNDRTAHFPRREIDVRQDAVDAVAYLQTDLPRLKVNVRCTSFHRVGYQPLHPAYDRGIARQIPKRLEVLIVERHHPG